MENLRSKSLNTKILVTGFEPFGGETYNPSAWLLEKIKVDPELSEFCETLLLPVTFHEAHKPVQEAIQTGKYKAWVGFGQAGGRSRICLERVALNWMETQQPDNSGAKPEPGLLVPNAEKAYFSKAPIEKMKSVLDLAGIPSEISFTAGAYVCNSLYYRVLHKLPHNMWGLFVHVPYTYEQVIHKNEKVYLEESTLWQSAQLILQSAKNF